ncbi:CIR protein [Plasmodium chabaudi chabaudi]|uniref:CIR protein n=1 Tax=Plasmodium chabaudi chabaudi TaxID=31271 RepID=A0A4V0K413_PLACU|nr:CIR protein [Plasmodium chabaudi chabaudi]VTZ67109.1 CIR protein [Plasmodium chabaudi chabaudi]|eukprot:XP_016652920.1 CIR protein [Plasmodium chabaudi chabaudi]
MTLNLCSAFKGIGELLPDSLSPESDDDNHSLYKIYCPTDSKTGNPECKTDGQRISAMFRYLLEYLFVNNDDDLKSENQNNEYSEYAILWLSNIIRHFNYKHTPHVRDFYATFIKDSDLYKDFHGKINEKNEIMKIQIGQMYNLYELLNILCNAITKYEENPSNCPECSKFTNKWEEKTKELVNKKTKFFEDENYCNVLLTLKKAYENFRSGSNNTSTLPILNEIEGISNCNKLCEKANRSWKLIHVEVKDVVEEKKVSGNGESEQKTKEKNSGVTDGSNITLPYTGNVSQKHTTEIQVNPPKTELDTFLHKEYELIGIGGIALLIPVISAVLYKYWFVGWRKKSTRKKNTKKVINLVVGTNLPKEL